jgi:PAS domain S-box-containing protein
VILCWDITEEIATLEEKVKSLENLILSENRYRTLIENQTDLISLCDAAGTRVYVNKRYCQFVGKEAHELVGTNILTLTLNGLSTDHIKRVFELTPETPAETNVVRLRNAQGKLVWISFSIKAIFDSDNKLREILTIGRDVSDLKLAEIRLNKYLDDIREIEFMTSHRVRAPIVTMLGLAELLRMNAIHWNDIICNFKGCLSELDQRTKELGEFIYRSLSVRNDQTRRL